MNDRLHLPITARRIRRDGWTNGRRVTFFVTLAATGSVTLACASVGTSRKSAYALKKRNRTFASLWDKGLAMAGKAKHSAPPPRAEGDKSDARIERATPSSGVNRTDPDRTRAEAERDRFFAVLQMRRSGASLRARISQGSCQRPQTVRR